MALLSTLRFWLAPSWHTFGDLANHIELLELQLNKGLIIEANEIVKKTPYALPHGDKMRVLTVIDVFTRELLAIVSKKHFRGKVVAEILTHLTSMHERPRMIQCDQGTDFT